MNNEVKWKSEVNFRFVFLLDFDQFATLDKCIMFGVCIREENFMKYENLDLKR